MSTKKVSFVTIGYTLISIRKGQLNCRFPNSLNDSIFEDIKLS